MRNGRRWRRGRARPKSAQALAMRARIVLAAADGLGNTAIAGKLGIALSSARKWRSRFAALCLDGLTDEPRPRRPRTVNDEQVEAVITRTLETTPADATHWSTRSLAAELGLSQSAVFRIWRAFGLAPHRQDSWKLSRDPLFTGKVRDVVGLYLDPPERAVVLCVVENPDPGPGPHRAHLPDDARRARPRHPQLQAGRHLQPVRRPGPRHRPGHRVPARPAPGDRVPPVPGHHRQAVPPTWTCTSYSTTSPRTRPPRSTAG